jgi:hypothetical protein
MKSITHTAGRMRRRARRVSAGLAAGIVFAAALVLVAIGYVGFVLWPRHLGEAPADTPAIPVTVAGVAFNVPSAAIRQPVQRRSGAQARLDLVFLWPSLQPPGSAAHPDRPAPSQQPRAERLFVTIAASTGTLSPSERLKNIYPRYIAGDVQAEADGLAARRFGDATPYAGEDLVFDPAAPERFVTRCNRAGATPGMCLLERRIGAADVTFRFPRDWLTEWREVAARIDYLIATLQPPAR